MKRPLRLSLLLLLPVFLLVSGRLSADIIELKSGEKIDCTILSETDTTITYKYMLTPKIPDTKTINKSDVKAVTKFTPAQVEYNEKGLDKILPTADLLSASDYESIIQDRLRTFVAKYPGTPEAKKVEEMIATLSEEKDKVLKGQLKMEGAWLDEATVKREKYNIDAYRLRLAMKAKAEDRSQDQNLPKEINALREFENLRTNYPASKQYIKALQEAIEILDKYDKRLSAMELEQPVLKAQREQSMQSGTPQEQAVIRSAVDAEERAFRANRENQNKAKLKWRDVYKYDLASIKEAQLIVAKDRTELKSINIPALENEVDNLNAAIRYIADGNVTEAENVMGRLRPNKANLVNKKVFDEYEKKLKELLAKQAADLKKAKAAAATAGTTPGAEGATDSSNPIAKAMAEKKAKEDAKKAAKAKAEAAAATEGTKTGAEPEEEQTMLQKINKYIPYIGGGLLLVLIIAMVMGKKKKDDDD
jgi:hypothetical protein